MSVFSDRLRKLRKECSLTQSEMAKRIGMGASTLAEYEQGVASPRVENLVKIAKYFSVSLDYLLGLTDTKERLDDKYPIEMLKHFKRPIINGKPATDAQLDQLSEAQKLMKNVFDEGTKQD